MIQKTLINSILTTLQGVGAIKKIYPYPLDGNPKVYPAVIFVKDNSDNSMATNADNFKTFRFKLWVVITLAGTNEETVFTDVLPDTVDAVVKAFDPVSIHIFRSAFPSPPQRTVPFLL